MFVVFRISWFIVLSLSQGYTSATVCLIPNSFSEQSGENQLNKYTFKWECCVGDEGWTPVEAGKTYSKDSEVKFSLVVEGPDVRFKRTWDETDGVALAGVLDCSVLLMPLTPGPLECEDQLEAIRLLMLALRVREGVWRALVLGRASPSSGLMIPISCP